VQAGLGKLLGLAARPSEATLIASENDPFIGIQWVDCDICIAWQMG